MCHMELYAGAQEKGLQFPNRFADESEDVIDAFKTVEATIEQVSKERAEAVSKPNKQPRTIKSEAAVSAQDIGDKKAVTKESFWPKQKSTSASGERGGVQR